MWTPHINESGELNSGGPLLNSILWGLIWPCQDKDGTGGISSSAFIECDTENTSSHRIQTKRTILQEIFFPNFFYSHEFAPHTTTGAQAFWLGSKLKLADLQRPKKCGSPQQKIIIACSGDIIYGSYYSFNNTTKFLLSASYSKYMRGNSTWGITYNSLF